MGFLETMDSQGINLDQLNNVKGFKLIHMNVRSLHKKIDQLGILLWETKVDIITMSETWLNSAVSSKSMQLEGFVEYRQDRTLGGKGKKRGGGLLTYVKNSCASESEELVDLNKCSVDIEAQWTILHRPHSKDVVVCNVYRPPEGKPDKAISYLNDCLCELNLEKVEVFIMGDINIDYLRKTSPNYKKLKFFVQSNGLTQLISNTTRNTVKGSSLLDLVITNSKYVSHSGTLDHFISDHQPIFIIKKKMRDKRPTIDFRGRSYRDYDKEAFKTGLLGLDWNDFYAMTDPDQAWLHIVDKFTPLLDAMCPIRTFKMKDYRPEWITAELVEQIKDRDYFYQKAKKYGNKDSWNIARHLRNVTNANIRQAKREFVIDELDNCKSDCKKFWRTIRTVIPSNKEKSKGDILLKDKVTNEKVNKAEVARYIKEFFINVGNAGGTGDGGETDDPETRPIRRKDGELEGWTVDKFTVMDVLEIVKGINVSKSSGIQDISSFIIKEVFTFLAPQITFMMNLTITSGTFPNTWKKGLVIPIPKGGNKTLVQNYRPISLLPLPGKIAEKLVHKQLMEHIESNFFISDNQHGFRRGHSCTHAVAQVTDFIGKKMDAGMTTLATFVDFRKAFDCVQHPILIEKLARLGLQGNMIKWFESYLTGWKQRVLANNVCSSYLDVKQGVPQGSVLGPLFYILYADDILEVIKHCKIALYADDTV